MGPKGEYRRTGPREALNPQVIICTALFSLAVPVTNVSAGDEIEPNDTLETATATGLVGVGSVTIDNAVVGNGDFPDRDVDLYAFQIEQLTPPPVLVTVEADASEPGLDAYLRLFDAAGAELVNNDDFGFGDPDPRLRTYLLEPGTYYVGVSSSADPRYDNTTAGSGRAGTTGTYSLIITTEAATLSASPYEPNDRAHDAAQMGSASFVVLGEFIGDGEHGRRDVDMYLLALTGPARVSVEVQVEPIGSPLDPLVRLRTCDDPIPELTWPDFCALGTNDDGSDDSVDSALTVGMPEGGSVYIMVSGAGNRRYDPYSVGSGEIGSVGPYSLIVTVSYIDGIGPNEPNDSIFTATPIPIFVPPRPEVFQTEGFLGDGPYAQTRGDRDFYKIRVADEIKFLTIDVTAAPESELEPVVALYGTDGRRLAVNGSRGGAGDAHLTTPVGCITVVDDSAAAHAMVMGTRQRFPNDPFVPFPDFNRLEEFAAGDGPGSTGAYELTVAVASPDPNCSPEPNDTLSTATPTGIVDEGAFLCNDAYIGDSFCPDPAMDVDMWSLGLIETPAMLQVAVFTCGSAYFQWEHTLRIFDAAGQELATQRIFRNDYSVLGIPLAVTLDQPGTYYIGLAGDYQSEFDPMVPCFGDVGVESAYEIAIRLTPGSVSPGFGGVAGSQPAPEDTGPPLLFATRLDDSSNVIDVLDADSGEVTASFTAPERFGGAEGIAYDGTGLYYVGTGWFPKLYRLDPESGEVLDEYILWAGSGMYTDAAMLAGELFLLDLPAQRVHVFDPVERHYLRTLLMQAPNPITLAGGMAALAGPGRLYIAEAFNDGVIYEVDPQLGRLTDTLPASATRPTALAGIGNDRLYLADWRSNTVEIVDRDGASVDTLSLTAPVGSLAGQASIGAFADFDDDGDVDLRDYGAFQRCFTGSEGGLLPDCERGDLNDDERVNLADFTAFPSASTGP